MLKALVALIAGIIVVGLIQSRAHETDYQKALLQSLAAGGFALLVVLYQLQRASAAAALAWLVPASCLAMVLAAVTFLRFESFSGEMVPRFSWRFGSAETPDLKVTPLAQTDSDEPTVESEGLAETGSWLEFLGNNRTGMMPEREFAIPTSADEVNRRWDIGIGEGWSSFAVSDGIAVTLEQRGEMECVTAYRLSDGQLLWLVEHKANHFQALGGGGPRSTPAIVPATELSPGRVYAQGAAGTVWCLRLSDGEILWQRDLLEITGWTLSNSENAISWGRAGSPLIVDNLCVLPLGGPDSESDAGRSLIALDAATGETRWRSGEQQISYASPMVMTLGGKRQIVSVNEADITGHDIASGKVLWSFPWEGKSNSGANCAAAIPAGEDQFVIGKGYGGGSSLIQVSQADDTSSSDESSSKQEKFVATELWHSSRVLKTKFNHTLVRDGIAYGLSNGALQAVEIESGERLWEQSRRDRLGQGQAVLVEDVLVVQGEEGEVVLVAADPDDYRELIRIPALQHKTWNIPTVVDNLILVRNAHQAIALELPQR
ncbi:outer membrane protein assembly factor BamB family protein [Rhodopirellula bahusiensis]|uniref:Oxidoreductase n=1 Tax=Rhodopirellula bahusiensis TaxID=2014065 RepID=A0A2G1W0P7_9BACT|nr:PQQ-binding-like beta-propeller repeat protein [Rhodopirellula bahusiensis]PHQ32597.1 oxidoreductase [Rhodopirellula bahusiensis]